jgi:hypothetical protein
LIKQRFVKSYLPALGNDPNLFCKIADLDGNGVKLTLAMDRPSWFIHEGELVINLFRGDLRVMSVAFSIAAIFPEVVNFEFGKVVKFYISSNIAPRQP